MNANYNFAN